MSTLHVGEAPLVGLALSELLQPINHHEHRPPGESDAFVINLIPLQPDPAIKGRPLKNPDEAEADRLVKLWAGFLGEPEEIARPRCARY
ncbi:hypothetical protein [Micromonospora sp. WMMD1082]|uniref:hypothetical protein n=1 Tax=Micromonospora sp. WMMD1082 TaxID=3016104 RepID=UPI0024168611|nr:hypothetical protein [Micromonospora sp. WMMD1082]MDG4797833.1 hypothetical protein [Micromonospora sp. WMMD1082]